jgi:hypothetical protein
MDRRAWSPVYHLPSGVPCSMGGPGVLVYVEEIGRVILVFACDQSCVAVAIGGSHPVAPFVRGRSKLILPCFA